MGLAVALPKKNIRLTIRLLLLLAIPFNLVNVLKAMYQRSRPWLEDLDIVIDMCPCDYGMPSGHSSYAMSSYLAVYIYFIETYSGNHQITLAYFKKKRAIKSFLGIACSCCAVLICISRIALGAHSWNQVIIGGLIGLTTAFFITDDFVDYLFDKGQNSMLLIWAAIGTSALVLFGIVFLTLFSDSLSIFNRNWDKCPECNKNFFDSTFLHVAGGTILPGIFLGLHYSLRYQPSNEGIHIESTNMMIYIKRGGLLMIALLPTGILGIIYMLKKHIQSIFGRWTMLTISGGSMFLLGLAWGLVELFFGVLLFEKYKVCLSSDFAASLEEDEKGRNNPLLIEDSRSDSSSSRRTDNEM